MSQLNYANILTIARVVAIPVFILCFYLPFDWRYELTAIIFASAAITDWLDGYIARKYEQSTKFGAFLDPVADKLMVVVALVLLVESYASALLAIPAIVIIAREVAISALREWMAGEGSAGAVSVNLIGKIKTTFQFCAIVGLLMFSPTESSWVKQLAWLLLYGSVAFTIWSMVIYLRAALPQLMADEPILFMKSRSVTADALPTEDQGDSVKK